MTASRWRQRLYTEFWGIGLLDHCPADLIAKLTDSPGRLPLNELAEVAWLPAPPGDRYLADPFGWPGRKNIILCEDYDYGTGLGRIAAIDLAVPGPLRIHPLPIGFSCHLSYPFAWHGAGADGTPRIYCLPESGAAREARIFALTADEAFQAVEVRPVATVVVDLSMADPTLFQLNGFYWIAYTDTDIGPHNNLCLRFCETLDGPWWPHPANPVKVDINSARPGGTVFSVGDALYRPAQDCSRSYGGALAINRITRCDSEAYAEELVGFIDPDPAGPYPDGLHTLSLHEGRWLVDGQRHRLSVSHLLRKAARKLRWAHFA